MLKISIDGYYTLECLADNILTLLKLPAMETINQIPRKNEATAFHEHKWTVITSHWQCETCGRTYG